MLQHVKKLIQKLPFDDFTVIIWLSEYDIEPLISPWEFNLSIKTLDAGAYFKVCHQGGSQ
jgi:hypothetical protein